MEKLLVFYGDVICDQFGGVDFSQCDSFEVAVIDLVNRAFADVRKSIRARLIWSCDAWQQDDR